MIFSVAPSLSLEMELTRGGEGFLTLSGDSGPGREPVDEIIVVENFFLELERLVSDQNK